MGIYNRQFKEILAQELLRYLLEGRLPSVAELSTRVSKVLSKEGKVTYKYIPQPYKAVFQSEIYNNSLDRIKFDLDLFQEELLDLIGNSVKRITYADLYHKINSHGLANLKAQLRAALFTITNADFYFLGAFDNFLDSTKTNLKDSTPNVLNLSERCLNIPIGESKTTKLKIEHLSNFSDWPVIATKPEQSKITAISRVAGTSFANIFTSATAVWAVQLQTKTSGPAEISVTFPLAGPAESETEVLINRIEMVGHSPSEQRVKVMLSTDNVNYSSPLGYEEGILMSNLENSYAMDFETNLVQYVTLIFSKDSPDLEITPVSAEKEYRYIFGLRDFSAYTIGRGTNAVFYSKPFKFSNKDGKISKISVQSKFQLPQNTDLAFYVSRATQDGRPTSWVPINPMGSPTKAGVAEIVSFSNNISNSVKFTVDAGAATQYGSAYQGKVFYRIGPGLNPDPIFGSVKIYRGQKLWHRDSSDTYKITENSNVYLDLSSTPVEYLYTTKKEQPGYNSSEDPQTGIKSVVLTLSAPPYYDGTKGHALKPAAGVDVYADRVPNYAVYRVLQASPVDRATANIPLSGGVSTYDIGVLNFITQSTDSDLLPEVSDTGRTTIFRPSYDYVIETEDIGGKLRPTGRILIPTGSSITQLSVTNLVFTYTPDPDITHKVTRIEGNFVTLTNAMVNPGDSITIEYRYIPSGLLAPSLKLFSGPAESSARSLFVLGTDYTVDPTSSSITKLPGSAITDSAYADYKYRDVIPGIQTFTIWAKVASENGTQIKFELNQQTKKNKLTVDSEAGEVFYINTPQGVIDLTRTTTTSLIGPGWVQFIVRSKDPDSNVLFGNNLIDQVIQIRDTSGKKVFKEGSTYFSDLIAFREPMIQRTLNHLRVNTLRSDHQTFAVDDFTDPNNSYVVINFMPASTTDLYNRIPTDDADTTSRPSASGEAFYMVWETKGQDNNQDESNILVRIDLERQASTDGAVSPKVFDYQIRAST